MKHTRRPFERMHRIHQAIRDGRLPNCSSLAEELEVTPKTVMRDITFMRDNFRLPLVYDAERHGYRYEGDVSDFPSFEIGAEEIAALFFTRTALESIRGTELAGRLREAFGKLTRSIGDRVALDWADLDEAFSRKVPNMPAREVKLFGELADAVVRQLGIGFHYRKLGGDAAETRKVRPLHLGEVDGGWYLIAFDEVREALRTFALPRITRLKVGTKHFDRPPGFDGREHLRRSFGIWSGEGESSVVRVILSDYAARLAQERRWHPTQEVKVLDAKGDRVEVSFEAGALQEVVRWVLSFGSKAKVIAPRELKSLVRDEVKKMAG
ncbi:WYL domain-containing protein [Haloferula helveola]